jgi:hypothetical protein
VAVVTRIVATSNLQYTLSDAAFEHGLRLVLSKRPDILAIQEAGKSRDHSIRRITNGLGYAWARPSSPNGDPVMPVAWEAGRYRPRSCKAILLARREFVGHLPGRKTRLPASWCTEVILDDLVDGKVVVVEVFHMTAEIQGADGGYKKDAAHWLRVQRHKREKFRLGRRSRAQKRKGRVVYPAGDGNFDGMQLGGFVSCWTRRSGGTLGWRSPDVIFGATRGSRLETVETASDHDTLIVTYP